MTSMDKDSRTLGWNTLVQGQDMQQSAWVGSALDGSRFANSTLRDVAFLNTSLANSTFAKASLNNARFTNCDMRNVVIEGSAIDSLSVNGVDVSALIRKGASTPGVAIGESGKLFIGDNLRPDMISKMGLTPISFDAAIAAASRRGVLQTEDKSDGKENSSDGNETGKESSEDTGKESCDPEMGAFDRLVLVGLPKMVAQFVKPVL